MPTLYTNTLNIVDLLKPYDVKELANIPQEWQRVLLFYHQGSRDFRDVMNFRDKSKFISSCASKATLRMLLSDLEDAHYERQIYCFHQGNWFKVFSDRETLTFLETEPILELQDGDVMIRLQQWTSAFDTMCKQWMTPYKLTREMQEMYREGTQSDLKIPLPLSLAELTISLTKELIKAYRYGETTRKEVKAYLHGKRMEDVSHWLENCHLS